MKALRVVFFGTPEFASFCLSKIHQSDHHIVGVVTAPDKPTGRGLKMSQSAVKTFADQQNLPVFQPEKLRDPTFLDNIRNLNADIFVVVAFRMMPKVLFDMPRYGTFNLHASLLPDYRGAAPINYAIINGEKETGATTFFINEKIDEGNILLQEKIPIGDRENAGELHDRLMVLGAKLCVKTLDGIAANTIEERPQAAVQKPKNAFKIFKEGLRINWKKKSAEVYNFVRGMSPFPAAFTEIQTGEGLKTLKIYAGEIEIKPHNFETGTYELDKKSLKFYTADGEYYPTDVQLQGKKRMPVKDFLNGFAKA